MPRFTHKFHPSVFSNISYVDVKSRFEIEYHDFKIDGENMDNISLAFVDLKTDDVLGFIRKDDSNICLINTAGLNIVKTEKLQVFTYELTAPIYQKDPIKTTGDLFIDGSPTWEDEDHDKESFKKLSSLRSLLIPYDGDKHLQKMIENDHCLIPLSFVNSDPLKALDKMNIDRSFYEQFKYDCPFVDGNKYNSLLPFAVIVKPEHVNDSKMLIDTFLNSFSKDMISEKNLNDTFFVHSTHPDSLIQNVRHTSRLGHGYTSGTLPSDGSVNTKICLIEYEHAYVMIEMHVWYNK